MKTDIILGLLFLAGAGLWIFRALRPDARVKARWAGPAGGPHLSAVAALLWAASWLLITVYFLFLDGSEHYATIRWVWVVIVALPAIGLAHDVRHMRREPAHKSSYQSDEPNADTTPRRLS